MIRLCKLIAGVSYYTNYNYKQMNEIVEQQMKLMITERGVDVIQAIRNNVDAEDKHTREIDGGKNLVFINESGLYSLILKSRLDSAKDFKRWVTEDVLASQQQELRELKEQTKLIPAFFNAGSKHKGCSNIVKSAMESEEEEDVEEVYLTVLQWLQAKGVTLSTTQLNTMRKRAAQS